jgi:hypothetical protein
MTVERRKQMIEIETGGSRYTLDTTEDMMLSEASLHNDMCLLPRTIGRYADIMGDCKTHALSKKNAMERVEARIDQAIRKEAKETGDRTTEPGIAKLLASDPEVTEAREAYYKAEGQFVRVEGFYRALRDKATLAVALCYFQKEEVRFMGPGS